MNTANKLTMLRVILIPAFLVVLYIGFEGNQYVALAIFAVACITDFADGWIARNRGQVTDFGKFMDPLADKVLVVAALLWFTQQGLVPAWAALVVIIREFAVQGLRLVAVNRGLGNSRRIVGKNQNGFDNGMHHPDVFAAPAADYTHMRRYYCRGDAVFGRRIFRKK